MESVTIKTIDVLARLHRNRAEHRDAYQRALDGYREAVIAELDAMLNSARNGREIRRIVELEEPRDHTADYDVAIDMLQLSTKPEIELSFQDFRHFMRDEWPWMREFVPTSNRYGANYKTS